MTYPTSKEQFEFFQTQFRAKSHAKATTAADHIIYNLMRGKPLHTGFTPITNAGKLNAHNNQPDFAYHTAVQEAKWKLQTSGWVNPKNVEYQKHMFDESTSISNVLVSLTEVYDASK